MREDVISGLKSCVRDEIGSVDSAVRRPLVLRGRVSVDAQHKDGMVSLAVILCVVRLVVVVAKGCNQRAALRDAECIHQLVEGDATDFG